MPFVFRFRPKWLTFPQVAQNVLLALVPSANFFSFLGRPFGYSHTSGGIKVAAGCRRAKPLRSGLYDGKIICPWRLVIAARHVLPSSGTDAQSSSVLQTSFSGWHFDVDLRALSPPTGFNFRLPTASSSYEIMFDSCDPPHVHSFHTAPYFVSFL